MSLDNTQPKGEGKSLLTSCVPSCSGVLGMVLTTNIPLATEFRLLLIAFFRQMLVLPRLTSNSLCG